MGKVYTIGQSVFDILFKNNQPFAAKVGGSMLNTSVSLGRLGVDVNFIGEYGNDFAGNITKDFLNSNNVKTDFCHQFEDGQTTVSLAFIKENSDAAYNFYRNMPKERLMIEFPEPKAGDLILFGSFYIFDEAVEKKTLPFLKKAKENGAVLMYDPNFRKPHYNDIERLRPKFDCYLGMADIVRGSNEDFKGIFNADNIQEVVGNLTDLNKILIYTSAQNGVDCYCQGRIFHEDVPKINPINTIGAGDTFNAGIIYSLSNMGYENINKINTQELSKIIQVAISFSSHVCLSQDNYLSEEFVQSLTMK